MTLPKFNFGPNTRHLETHAAEIAGVKGEVLVLLHSTEQGFIHEVLFAAEIATRPVFIGEACGRKPTKEQIEQFKQNFVPYIERQKELRQGWH